MKSREDMRKFLLFIALIIFICFAVEYFLGKLDPGFVNVFYVFCVVIVFSILIKIKMYYFVPYNNLESAYEKLRNLHYTRYKLYLSPGQSREKIDFYSQEIQKSGKAVVAQGEELKRKRFFSKKRKRKIQEIISKAEELMQRESSM